MESEPLPHSKYGFWPIIRIAWTVWKMWAALKHTRWFHSQFTERKYCNTGRFPWAAALRHSSCWWDRSVKEITCCTTSTFSTSSELNNDTDDSENGGGGGGINMLSLPNRASYNEFIAVSLSGSILLMKSKQPSERCSAKMAISLLLQIRKTPSKQGFVTLIWSSNIQRWIA